MKGRRRVAIRALAVFALLLAVAVAGCGGSTTVTSGTVTGNPASGGMMYGTTVGTMMRSSTSVSMMNGGTRGTSTGGAAVGNAVSIAGFAFSPASSTIKVGDKITWTNKDSTTHTVTADDGSFNSGDLATGATFSFTFTKAGSHAYHCSIHPSMKATVVVQ
jgi:plastocyanin